VIKQQHRSGRYQTIMTTDDEQVASNKQPPLSAKERRKSNSIVSPADLASSNSDSENPLLNRELTETSNTVHKSTLIESKTILSD
jgi:hypothetical protein